MTAFILVASLLALPIAAGAGVWLIRRRRGERARAS